MLKVFSDMEANYVKNIKEHLVKRERELISRISEEQRDELISYTISEIKSCRGDCSIGQAVLESQIILDLF